MERKSVRKFRGLIEYLDRRLGASVLGGGAEFQYYCPFCIDRIGSESNNRKLWVQTVKGKVHCFRCGYGAGNLDKFFRDMNGGTLRLEELRIIKGIIQREEESVVTTIYKIFEDAEEEEWKELKAVPLPFGFVPLTDNRTLSTRKAWNYLKERGISARLVAVHNVGYALNGRYGNSLIFPIKQFDKQVYFTTRYCGKRERKTLNPSKQEGYYTRSDCLLNYDNVRGSEGIIIVEGAFDCMASKNTVGLLGKLISEVQIRLLEALLDYGLKEVIIGLDADAAIERDKLYSTLLGRFPKVTVLPLDYGDPDERRDELKDLLRERRPLTLLDRVRGRLQK